MLQHVREALHARRSRLGALGLGGPFAAIWSTFSAPTYWATFATINIAIANKKEQVPQQEDTDIISASCPYSLFCICLAAFHVALVGLRQGLNWPTFDGRSRPTNWSTVVFFRKKCG